MEKSSLLRDEHESRKFMATLEKICEESFTLSDDTILEKLYSHIESSFNTTDHLMTDIASWLETIFNGWNESGYFHGVKVFALRLMGLLGSSLDGFGVLEAKNILFNVQNLASSDEVQQDSCLMVPIINVFIMFLRHRRGWKWISKTMIWKFTVKAIYEDRSIYTKRAGVQFLSLLLIKSDEFGSNHGINILSVILEPLIANQLINISQCGFNKNYNSLRSLLDDQVSIRDSEEVVYVTPQLTSAAKFASDIIGEILLKPNANIPATLFLVFQDFNTDTCVIQKDILDSCSSPQDEQIFSLLLLMINLSNAVRLHHNICCLLNVYKNIYTTVRSMIKLNHFHAVINYCVSCLSWCYKIKKINKMCISNCPKCEHFEQTMINSLKAVFHNSTGKCVSPTTFIVCRNTYETEDPLHLDNTKVAKTFLHQMLTTLPSDAILRQKLCAEYMQQGVLALIRSLPFITNERNGFKLFVDAISFIDFLAEEFLESFRDTIIPGIRDLLTLVEKLIEEYKLQFWKIHVANIKPLCMAIMKIAVIENLDVRTTITSIKVLKSLLPWVLLPDFIQEDDMLPMRFSFLMIDKLDSISWEVRDSTLEFFQTMLDLSESSLPIFKSNFHDKIVDKIFTVGVHDESSYVRGSALDFFSRATRTKQLSSCITPSVLCEHALKAVIEDNMPVVRKIACELITALYITYVPSLLSDADAMYDTMFIVVSKDLDWEVKKAALIFWECTIRKHLLDKSIHLPPSTNYTNYSEKKDNTTLQVVEVLKALGQIGCLKAVWLGLNDECDLKVSQEAFRILNYLDDLDKDWSYVEHILHPDGDTSASEGKEEENTEMLSKVLIPKQFFNLVQQQDWKENLGSRQNWIENKCDDLASLMDHILNVGKSDDNWDHNAVDCY